nr:Krueppel-like factor 13 [Vicugna pacos]
MSAPVDLPPRGSKSLAAEVEKKLLTHLIKNLSLMPTEMNLKPRVARVSIMISSEPLCCTGWSEGPGQLLDGHATLPNSQAGQEGKASAFLFVEEAYWAATTSERRRVPLKSPERAPLRRTPCSPPPHATPPQQRRRRRGDAAPPPPAAPRGVAGTSAQVGLEPRHPDNSEPHLIRGDLQGRSHANLGPPKRKYKCHDAGCEKVLRLENSQRQEGLRLRLAARQPEVRASADLARRRLTAHARERMWPTCGKLFTGEDRLRKPARPGTHSCPAAAAAPRGPGPAPSATTAAPTTPAALPPARPTRPERPAPAGLSLAPPPPPLVAMGRGLRTLPLTAAKSRCSHLVS